MKFNKDAWDKYIAERNPLIVSSLKSFGHTLKHFGKRNNEDDRRFCLVEIDQAIELFFKGILLSRGKNPYYMRFQRLLKEVKPILELSEKDEILISRLHEKRDVCQHEGEIPGTNETEYLVHSALRFFLDKAHNSLGIAPDQMTDMIPGLLLMDMKEASVGELPKKPEVLHHLEIAATTFLALGDLPLAFSQISIAAAKAIDIIYESENGPPLAGYSVTPPHRRVSDFDPRNLINKEINSMLPDFEVKFEKLKLRFAKIPFDMTASVQLVPMVAYAIRKLSYLEEEGALQPKTSEGLLKILRIDLLKSIKPQLPKKAQRIVGQYLKASLTFDFLLKEFLFLRQFIMSNDIVSSILKEYIKKHNEALFKAFEEK